MGIYTYNDSHDLSKAGYFLPAPQPAFGTEGFYLFTYAQTITCFDSWQLVSQTPTQLEIYWVLYETVCKMVFTLEVVTKKKKANSL